MYLMQRIHIACLFLLLNLFAVNAQSQNIDINILRSINPQSPTSRFWRASTDSYLWVSGSAMLGTLAIGLIEHDKERQHDAYEMLIAVGINVVVTDGLKTIFKRVRPAEEYPGEIYTLTKSRDASFPSGHTSLAFATATAMSLTYKKWYVTVPAYVWAGCVGYSRMYLGKHFPSDVLGGALIGTGSAYLSHWLTKKLFRPKQLKVDQ